MLGISITGGRRSRRAVDDRIVSLEDGHRYWSLKRHLTARGMTPEAYRAKWGLPPDAPMVSPSFSKRRAEIARQMGLAKLGHKAIAAKRHGRDQTGFRVEITCSFV